MKDQGWTEKSPVEKRNRDDRHHETDERIDDQREPRIDHEVELADVIGGPGHQIADSLAVVEGLTLPEQGDEEFIPRVTFETFGDNFSADLPAEIQAPRSRTSKNMTIAIWTRRSPIRRIFQNGIECETDEDRHEGIEEVLPDHANERACHVAFVAAHVGGNPARRTGGVRREASLDGEL